jgi:putative protease
MAITCPRCGAGFDVTLFQFGRRVRCDCGAWVCHGHVLAGPTQKEEGFDMAEEEIGKITHYFGKIGVAAIELTKGSLKLGDTIHIHGHTSDFNVTIDSMQIDNESVEEAAVGQSVGMKVPEHAREHDVVYKVTE